jgi:hypothetical protein
VRPSRPHELDANPYPERNAEMMTRLIFHARSRARVFRVAGVAVVLAVPVATAEVPAAARSARSPRFQSVSEVRRDSRGGVGVAAARALRTGPLPANDAELTRGKATATRVRESAARRGPVAPTAPAAARSFEGLNDPNVTPSDSTGAIGTKRFIELVNEKTAVYSRTGNTPLVTGTLTGLTGAGAADSVFDPQIILWVPKTRPGSLTCGFVQAAVIV